LTLRDKAKIAPARLAVLQVLRDVRRGAFADRAFERLAPSLAAADRRLAQELAYGVLRLRGRLDHIIEGLVEGGSGRLDADVVDILRLGAYQLLELDRVPAYAAVADAVEAAKRIAGKGAASLTNAVLRRLGRDSSSAVSFPRLEDDPVAHLTTWGSHPRWLIERWLARWPVGDVEQLVQYNNARPAVYVSVTRSRERTLEQLATAGIEAEPVRLVPASLRVEASALQRMLELAAVVVQDPGAAAVVDYMALDPGTPVVDLCAAPGGKAAALAARGHEVWAFDNVRARLARLLENRARLGLSRLHVAVADSTRPPLLRAQAVLLDVPCSGTGTLARRPDSRWRLRARDLEMLVQLQRRLLDAAAELVTPGGQLLYATCTLEPEENEEQVEAFLGREPQFELDPPPAASVSRELLGEGSVLRILPHRHGMDGVYAARFRRRID
jgi:16S rRNA (cytosine967-C5)-methyltransferase